MAEDIRFVRADDSVLSLEAREAKRTDPLAYINVSNPLSSEYDVWTGDSEADRQRLVARAMLAILINPPH